MRFRQAVEGTPGLQSTYRRGLQAVRTRDKRKIICRDGANVAGSVNIDAALERELPSGPRWDYAIGMIGRSNQDRIVWIEVHPASSSDVKVVLAKLDWLTGWLAITATKLRRLENKKVWLATGPVAIPKGSRQARWLASKGLRFPRSHVVLEDVWQQ